MEYERYDTINNTDDLSSFDFTSVGEKGPVHMRVTFTPTGLHNVFVLAFGCVTSDDDIDDRIVNNNGDRNKILATVADMKKKIKKVKTFGGREITLVEDESLNNIKIGPRVQKMVEEARESLRKIKNFPF